MNEERKRIIEWCKKNALCLTHSLEEYWDDGPLMFKRSDIKAQGEWSQEAWNENIKDFKEEYIDYEELIRFLESE